MSARVVLVTEPLADGPRAWLGEHCAMIEAEPASIAGLDPGLLARVEGLVVRSYTRVDGALLAKLPGLRVVGRAGVGLDNVDLEACAACGVRVVHRPGANTRAVVEFVLAAVLGRWRDLGSAIGGDGRAMDPAAWEATRRSLTAARQIGGSTVGVLGLGRIGSQVARAFAALDARVIYHDVRAIGLSNRFGAEPVGFEELCAQSETLTVHVDGRASNRGLIGERALGLMRADVLLVNASRGFVVDAAALAGFLRAHPGASAVIDVHEPEPVEASNPLVGVDNAVLSPHVAGATAAAKREMSWVVRDVVAVLEGREPEFEAARAGV